MTVTQLPIVSLRPPDTGEDGECFYVDERLREYRAVGNPSRRFSFDEADGDVEIMLKYFRVDPNMMIRVSK